MTTVLVSEIFPPKVGGSGRWLWEVYRRLPRDEFVILAGEDDRASAFDAGHDLSLRRAPLSFPTRFVRRASLPHYRGALRALRGVVEKSGADRIHCGRTIPEGLLGLVMRWRYGIEYTCYVHGEEVNLSNRERCPAWFRRRVYGSRELGQIVGLVLRGAGLLIANSDNTKRILTERWRLSPGRVRILHPGVDTRQFHPAPRDPEVRARLGWSGRRVVLTVGRLQRRKGHDMMIRALGEIRDKVPDVLYAVVGAGEEQAALEELARQQEVEDLVLFMGEVEEQTLVKSYQQCDLFVLPNREIDGDIEGFGMVLLEAQACGKPVVAGQSGGTAETMQIDRTGYVVSCDEPSCLADVVGDLLADRGRRRAMGHAAREWVVSMFDWEVVSRRAADVLGRESNVG